MHRTLLAVGSAVTLAAVCIVCVVGVGACRRDEPAAEERASRRPLSTGDDPADWDGATGTRRVHQWVGIAIDDGTTAAVRWRSPPADWTSHDAVRFYLDHAAPTDRELEVLIESDDPATPGRDGYAAVVDLGFRGPRRVVLRRAAMSAVGAPRGFDRVTGFELRPRGAGPGAELGFAALDLVDAATRGPLVTDEELAAALDLTRPELAPIAAARGSTAIRAAIARYLRDVDREWSYAAAPNDDAVEDDDGEEVEETEEIDAEGIVLDEADLLAAAERIAAGEITLVHVTHRFDGPIDWTFNPTRHLPNVDYNRQWENHLNHMPFWSTLAAAYRATSDERFAAAWAAQLRRWIASCPYDPEPKKRYQSAQWEMLSTAARMKRSWPDAFFAFRRSPAVTDDDLVDYLKSSLEHARHLHANYSKGASNHQSTELFALHTIGCVFPEFREARDWRRRAAKKIRKTAEVVFYDDGFTRELSPTYQNATLKGILALYQNAARYGFADEVGPIPTRLENAFAVNLWFMAPDGKLPAFNDSGQPNGARFLAEHGDGLFPHRADFLFAASGGREGSRPAVTSHLFPWAGFCVMRSSWETTANFAVLDAGPLGSHHVHQDKLHLVLWSYGREILYDGGGGRYAQSPWREYAVDTLSHNSVVVDGLGQRRSRARDADAISARPVDVRWETDDVRDFAAATYDDGYDDSPRAAEAPGEPIARHRRGVLFVKPDLFVVVDAVESKDDAPHAYQARWHVKTTRTIADRFGVVRTTDDGLSNLAVIPLVRDGLDVAVASAQLEPERLGWHVDKKAPAPVPTTTITHTRAGPSARFVTLLLPLPPGASDPAPAIEVGPDATVVRFAGGRVVTVVAGGPDAIQVRDRRGPDDERVVVVAPR